MRPNICLILICGFLCIQNKSFSQSFHLLPRADAYWSVLSFDETGLQYDDVLFTIKGDTLIHGKDYSIVYRLNDDPTIYDTVSTLHCFIRQDTQEGKIYFIRHYLGETTEKSGYDFTAEIGDSVYLAAFDYGNTGDSLFIREKGYCDSIQLLNGEYRKMYFFRSPFSDFSHEITFIDGIGDYYSTFPDKYNEYDAFHSDQSTCVEQDNQLIWSWLSPPDSARCGFNYLGLKEKPAERFVSVFPDPASAFISIEFAHLPEKSELQIFDTGGTPLRYISLEAGTTKETVDISDLPSGIYLVSLKTSSHYFSSKFSVVH